jgi:hypothetical protein
MMYSFGDTVTVKRTIANIIKNIDPQDTPCVSMFGTRNESKFAMQNFPNHKYEWLQDIMLPQTTLIAESGFDASETDLTVTTGEGAYAKDGDVWLINETGEKVLVTGVSTDTWTIVRGFGATSGAAAANGGTLTRLYSARLEGEDSDDAYYTTPTAPYNYSQILHAEVEVSGSEQDATSRYGIPNQRNYQIMKWLGGMGGGGGKKGRAGDLMIQLEKTFFYGERIERASSTRGAMGGFDTFVNVTDTSSSHVVNAAGVELSEDMLNNVIQAAWGAGGKPDTIICNAFQKRLISSWYRNYLQVPRTESTVGMVFDNIETEFGVLRLQLNRWCQSDRVYITQSDLLGWVTLRDWDIQKLAKTGDADREQIIGEFGFVLQMPKAHGYLYNLATA